MNSTGIISYARSLTNISQWQIDNTSALIILNKAYKDFYKKIVNLDKNYFWDRRTSNIVDWQYEYSILSPSAWVYGIFKPEKLRIKYTSTSDFINVTFTDWDMLTETPEWYAVNQSKEEPIAVITDNKFVHIFPTPDANVTGWLLIEGAKQPYELTISSTENEILIDPLYHEVIAYMMCPSMYKETSLLDKKNDALQEAELEINKALKSMWLNTTNVVRWRRPDLSWLE